MSSYWQVNLWSKAMLPVHTILHPTDFSEQAGHAFQVACSLAQAFNAQLVVLHVSVPYVAVYGEGFVVPPPENIDCQLRDKLDEIKAPDPRVRIERCLIEGDPATEILRMAKESHCDLILMGTHGRTGLGRLLMGSIAEQVVRKAPCPVLTLRAPVLEAPAENNPARLASAGTIVESAT
jgi:nucleotide-binding universal stress UspA family protein